LPEKFPGFWFDIIAFLAPRLTEQTHFKKKIWLCDADMNEGGDMNLSPHSASALNDDNIAPVRELSHRGAIVAG